MSTIPQLKAQYRPDTAWPTIGLFCTALLGLSLSYVVGSGLFLPWTAFSFIYGASIWHYIISTIIGVFCLLLSTICCYAQFTVAHDAIHGAVSKNRNINDWIGFFAQLWLGPTASWEGLKYNHLTHHAHTNDSKLDPDYWCSFHGPGGKLLTPLRWLTVDVSYLLTFLPKFMSQTTMTQINFVIYEILMVGFIILSVKCGFFLQLLQFWIIPSRFAMFLLAYAFDFLPHYPHMITKQENKYKTTAYISIPWLLRPFLSLIIFYQNYHIAHHLVPTVPFYHYKSVFKDMNSTLMNEDMIIRSILPEFVEAKINEYIGDDEGKLKRSSK